MREVLISNLPMNTLRAHRFFSPAAAFLGLCLWFASLAAAQAQLSAAAQARMTEQIHAVMADKKTRTPVENKLSTQILMATREAASRGVFNPAAPRLHSKLVVGAAGTVELDVKGNITPALLKAIETEGGKIINSHPEANTVRVALPVAKITTIAARPEVRFIKPAVYGQPNTGAVDTEGDTTHQAIQARQTYGATGAGVTVGVLSDSIDDNVGSLAAAISSGDLDGNNTFIINGQGGTGEGEGLAMCEIVHDLVPDAVVLQDCGGVIGYRCSNCFRLARPCLVQFKGSGCERVGPL